MGHSFRRYKSAPRSLRRLVRDGNHHYRLIDTAGSEIGIVEDARDTIAEGDEILLPEGVTAEIYDDADGREGEVDATLVVE